ncbi:hypothetical protein DF132_17470 [Burkholderia cenocepacia]|nr:hypothetical protein DF132_17470 [Burkholderia cenocepacia]
MGPFRAGRPRSLRSCGCDAAHRRRRIAYARSVGCRQPPSKRRSVSIKRFFTKNQLKNFDGTTRCIDTNRCNA